jgi:histidine triad (HIT) family protein
MSQTWTHDEYLVSMTSCVFCQIASGQQAAHTVFQNDIAVGILDRTPVFKGHVLVMPRSHVVTLTDLASGDVGAFFEVVQRVTAAVTTALDADGTFVAINNTVSQSVAHLHVHIVPRRRKDGLRGFFWPRTKYDSTAEAAEFAGRIAAYLL